MTTNTASRPPANPYLGKTLAGKYKLDRLIGRGGMGLVYLAQNVATDREVVVKMLAPHWADDAHAVARFEREGRRLAQLSHPNIVELYDIGWEDGQSFIVMEYIHGEPLRHYLNRRAEPTMGLREFAPLADQILGGVAYAHEQQMMLRDIKPSNIMLCERDERANVVKMLDFGLAKLVDGDDVEVTKANVIGTAGYLAPEQIKGEKVDVRVDVYALGILFFVMLTGRSPIIGENDGAVLYNHVHGKPLRLASVLPDNHDLPRGVIELVHRCMEKDPAARPADAGALRELLRNQLPSVMFEPPRATAETREAIESYHRAKRDKGVPPSEEDASSNEWTRPHLRELLAKKGKGLPKPAADDEVTGRRRTIGLVEKRPSKMPRPKPRSGSKSGATPPPPPPQGARAVRAKSKTMMGLGPAESLSPVPALLPTRRPPPAKTPVSARMERLPSHPDGALVETRMMASGSAAAEDESPGSTLHGAPRPDPKPVRGKTSEMAREPGGVDKTQTLGSGSGGTAPPIEPPVSLLAGSSSVDDGIVVVLDDDEAPGRTSPAGRLPTLPPPPITEPVGLEEMSDVRAIRRSGPSLVLFGALAVASVGAVGGLAIWAMSDDPARSPGQVAAVEPAGDDERAVEPQAEDEAPAADGDEAPEPSPDATAVVTPAEVEYPLEFEIPAEAEVFVDGQSRGTEVSQLHLAPGTYAVRVELEGHRTWEREVEVDPAGTDPLDIELEPLRGGSRRASNDGAPPAKSQPKSQSKSQPSASKPAPDPSGPAKPAAEPKPKPEPKSDDDGLFIPSKKPKKDDGGIFLPVGSGK